MWAHDSVACQSYMSSISTCWSDLLLILSAQGFLAAVEDSLPLFFLVFLFNLNVFSSLNFLTHEITIKGIIFS